MHEMGIVTHVAKTVEALAKENGIEEVLSVTLEIGEVSGIMTDYFTDCWNYFRAKRPVIAKASLVIETIPAVTRCEACGGIYPTTEYGRTCPHCGSDKTVLLQGNEMKIRDIAVAD